MSKDESNKKLKHGQKSIIGVRGVEGTISQGIRGFGLRECRYAGLDKVHLQHILTGDCDECCSSFCVVLRGIPFAKTRLSSFAKLAPY